MKRPIILKNADDIKLMIVYIFSLANLKNISKQEIKIKTIFLLFL